MPALAGRTDPQIFGLRLNSRDLSEDYVVAVPILAGLHHEYPAGVIGGVSVGPHATFLRTTGSEEFTTKIERVREAAFRLANRRLQPLGHLTAARNLSIYDVWTYAERICPHCCP